MSDEGEAFSAEITESGAFLFDAVMPGRYYLEYQLPEGGIFARAGGDNTMSGENGTGRGEWSTSGPPKPARRRCAAG